MVLFEQVHEHNIYQSTRNQHLIHKVPLCDVKLGVSDTPSARMIMGLVFYADTSNSLRYVRQVLQADWNVVAVNCCSLLSREGDNWQ
jgi:hypothetical protein